MPILLARDETGRVRSFANACRHRGVRVVDGGGSAKTLTCPFHAWTYNLDGSLFEVPVAGRVRGHVHRRQGPDRAAGRRGLRADRRAAAAGPEIDIDGYLGPGLTDELAMLDFADWAPYGEPHVHKVAANWKVTLDTFRENYHFNFLHRKTLAKYAYGGVLTFDPFGPHLRNASALRSIDALRDVPETQWTDVAQHFSYQYQLFPNTTPDVRRQAHRAVADPAARRGQVRGHPHGLPAPGLSDEERAKVVDMAPWICETVVDGEDFWVAARTEPGVRIGLLDTVVFGRNEPAPQHLHRGFADALAAR